MWQIIRSHLLASVNLVSHPELIRLLAPGETLHALINARAEAVLQRWVNYHLARASGENRRSIEGFGAGDLGDGEVYAILMEEITEGKLGTAGLLQRVRSAGSGKLARAQVVLDQAGRLGCRKFVTAEDIAQGNSRLNLAFTATLFNAFIGIHLPSEDEIRALLARNEELAGQVQALQSALKTLQGEKRVEAQRLDEERARLEAQLEEERAQHAQELLALQQGLGDQTAELEAHYRDALETQVALEKRNFEEALRKTFDKERDYKRNLERQLRQLRTLLLSSAAAGSKNALSASGASGYDTLALGSTTGGPFELDTLTKEIVEMTKCLVGTNAELSGNVERLRDKIKHNDKLNDVMSSKIREFSELLINERKMERRASVKRK